MVFFNYSTKLMAAKIVYYGPGLCGKTTNLQYIYNKTSPKARGEMVSLATETDRTLFFDLLPLDVGSIAGFKARFQLYTVPGQVFYNSTRRLVLKGVDAIVFVADSQKPMMDANIESFSNMVDNLSSHNLNIENIPYVIQYNKRDLLNILSIEELNKKLNKDDVPWFEAIAITGKGVIDTLKGISKLTIKHLRKKAQEQVSTPSVKPSFTMERKPQEPLSITKPKEPAVIHSDNAASQDSQVQHGEKKLTLKEKLDLLKQKRETIKQQESEIEAKAEEISRQRETETESEIAGSSQSENNDNAEYESEPTEEIHYNYSEAEDLQSNPGSSDDIESSLDNLKEMLLKNEEQADEATEEEESGNIDSMLSSVYSSVFSEKDTEISRDTDRMLNEYLLSNVPDIIQEITIEKEFTVSLEPDIYNNLQDAEVELSFRNENQNTIKQNFKLQISKPHKTIPQNLVLNLKFNVKGEKKK